MIGSCRIGTRSSALAVLQANTVAAIAKAAGFDVELVEISTSGDIHSDKPLHVFGEVGVFTKQLDDALLRGEIDMAVHSLKDVPTELVSGLSLVAVHMRGPVHDVLIASSQAALDRCEQSNATIATSSRRRKAQWLAMHPHHTVIPLRGNVHTRLTALDSGDIDAIIIAEAGVQRLGITPAAMRRLEWMVPAPAQGAIGVIASTNDDHLSTVWQFVSHTETIRNVGLERELLRRLSAGCLAPVGIHAQQHQGMLHIRAIVLSELGDRKADADIVVPTTTPDIEILETIMNLLSARGAIALLAEVRNG